LTLKHSNLSCDRKQDSQISRSNVGAGHTASPSAPQPPITLACGNERNRCLLCRMRRGGEEGGVSLKACKSCMQVKYCNAICQKNHWPKHKKLCKERAAEHAMRCCSMILRPRKTAQSASFRCLRD